jgi:hypothetical protein
MELFTVAATFIGGFMAAWFAYLKDSSARVLRRLMRGVRAAR